MNFINVFNAIQKNGGATYNINTSELNPTDGFIVSLVGFEKITKVPVDFKEFQEILLSYLTKTVLDQIGGRDDIYLGFWVEDNKLYIDLSEKIEDRDEAILQGYKRGQLAIYNANIKQVLTLQKLVSNDPDIETDKKH